MKAEHDKVNMITDHGGIRTHDLLITNLNVWRLSQLSHIDNYIRGPQKDHKTIQKSISSVKFCFSIGLGIVYVAK